MESKSVYSASYHEPCLQRDSFDFESQQSYFPPQWQNSPIAISLDDPNMDFHLLQTPPSEDPASLLKLSRTPSDSSPCSSEVSKQRVDNKAPVKKQDRRRAQNRAAQRAYRERKEQLRQELEVQVKMWQDKHHALRESYIDQAQEVQQLKTHIENLQVQLLSINDHRVAGGDRPLCEFDMWPEFDWKAS